MTFNFLKAKLKSFDVCRENNEALSLFFFFVES